MDLTIKSLIESHKPATLQSWSSRTENLDVYLQFTISRLQLSLTLAHLPATNTYLSTAVTIIDDARRPVRRRDLDPIRHDVRAVLLHPSHILCTTGIAVVILQALERVAEFEHEAALRAREVRRRARGWDAALIDTWEEVLSNPRGLDPATVADTAHHLLGRTPAELVASIGDETFRVVHVESVVRGDLLARFLEHQRALGERLHRGDGRGQDLRWCVPPDGDNADHGIRAGATRREDIIADMIRPRVTFHGTPLRSVRSIVRHGFVKPGRILGGRLVASPRSGIAHADRGIYSSPSAGYALSYTVGHNSERQRMATPLGMLPSLRLFVCATVMGRTLSQHEHGWERVHGPLADGFDAHWDGGSEYITYHEAAILPCYVVHLDLGCAAAREAITLAQTHPAAYQRQVCEARERRLHPKLIGGETAPGDRKRAAAARKAAAMKWFPCGYGSARGTQFVVEDIGEAEDDEEDYGEWQEDRHAYLSVDKEGHWLDDDGANVGALYGREEKPAKTLFLDGYQTARY